jgi:transcriptional regulator with GAF, ATPase, and Fis domain
MKARHIKDLALALLAEAEAMGADQHPDIGQGFCLREAVRRFEIDLITDALRRSGGRQARAAALLGTKATTLHHKIKQYRIKTNLLPGAAEDEPALNASTPQGALVAQGTAAEAQKESAAS